MLFALAAFVVWGAFARTWNLGTRPFWRDEAWVAGQVRNLGYAELLRQTATPLPPLFAAAAKLTGTCTGPPERGLRLAQAVAGIGVIPLVYAAARALRGPRSLALAAAGVAASSLMLVIWSRELKQYSFEALASVGAAALVFTARRARTRSRFVLCMAGFGALCALAPWFGYGAIFPLLALLALLIIAPPTTGPRSRGLLAGAVCTLVFAASFWLLWNLAAAAQCSEPSLQRYMAARYLGLDPVLLQRGFGHFASGTFMLLFPASWFLPVAYEWQLLLLVAGAAGLWLLALIGVLAWVRGGRLELAAWLFGPLLLLAAAAFLRKYPFGIERMMLFWAPPMILAVTAGVTALWRGAWGLLARRGGPALATAPLLGAVIAPLAWLHASDHRYWAMHDFPAVLATLEDRRSADEPVFVELTAAPCVRYYAPQLPPPVTWTPTVAGTVAPLGTDRRELLRQTVRRGPRRIWVLCTDEHASDPVRELSEVLAAAGYAIEVVDRVGPPAHWAGSAALLRATRR